MLMEETASVRYIISLIHEDRALHDRFDLLKEKLIGLQFQIQYVSNGSIIGKGTDNPIQFIKKLYNELQDFPFELKDELTVYYPTISRDQLNLFPDIDHATLKFKNDMQVVHPFRRYV